MTDHAKVIREQVSHIARGCRASTAHNPAPYENAISAALDALVAEQERAEAAEARVTELEAAVACRNGDVETWMRQWRDAEARVAALETALKHIPLCGNCMSGRFHQCETYRAALAKDETDE